jgi:hypothetical protein
MHLAKQSISKLDLLCPELLGLYQISCKWIETKPYKADWLRKKSLKLLGGWCAEDLSLPSADTVGRRLVACGHNRAIDLYIDSIREDHLTPLLSTTIADPFFF